MDRLIGRAAELARLRELLDDAAAGSGGALLLLGDAGIGKTTLIDAAAEQAEALELTVVRARAVEAELELPFAGLVELLRPVAATVAALEPPHAAALDAACGRATETAAGDQPPFAVAVALLALLERLAADAPRGVAVVVDDVHWLDAATLDALCFAARRLRSEPVAVLLAARPEPDRGLRARGLETIELDGLDRDAAAALLRAAAGEELAGGPLRTVLETAGGNPLALIELTRSLSSEQRAGARAIAEPIRPGEAIERAFRLQLDALPAETAAALLVPAADERLPLRALTAALTQLGLPAEALDAAERAGLLVADGGRLRFRHPLLRSAVYHAAPFAQRAQVHRALAAPLAERGEEGMRRAWHLAAAADAPDEQVAAALAAAGADAHGRGALTEAAHALARAAELTPPELSAARAERTLAAAGDLAAAGQPQRARALIDGAFATPPEDRSLRAALEHVRGAVTMRCGELDAGYVVLTEQAELAADEDPARAAHMLLDANLRNRVIGDYGEMTRIARRTVALAEGRDPQLAALGELMEALALVNTGRGAEADAIIARHEALLLDPSTERFGMEVVGTPAHASIWLERFDRAERIVTTQIERARARAAVTALIYPLAVRAQLALRRGRLRPALADAEESLRLAVETGQHGLVAFAAAMVSEVEATLGREADCREHAGLSIAICDAIGGDAMAMWGHNALGLLALGRGRPEDAIPPLEACARLVRRIGMTEPNTVQWAANLVEALARDRRELAARSAMRALEEGSGSAWAAAALLRCRGLLTPGEEGELLLARSIDAFEAAGARFEAARSRLCVGERMRRARRRRDAREPLQAARELFAAAGAAPWAARAEEELRATGQLSGEPAPAAWDELTPHELRVALLVAEGRTNGEVAAQLFVTRKTIEHHLSQVYRKLGLRSRTELARELASQARAA